MSNVFSFQDKKISILEKKRRSVERVFFENFFPSYLVLNGDQNIFPIKLLDISYDGCLISLSLSNQAKKNFKINDFLDLRLYFTPSSFLPIRAQVKHISEGGEDDKNGHRLGLEFDKNTKSFSALDFFIKFIYKFAEFSSIDKGDNKVYFL